MNHDDDDMHRSDLATAVKAMPKAGPRRRSGPLSPEERIEALRAIVREHQCARVEGQLVDAFSASVTITVYDALNERNRAILANMTVRRMILVAYAAAKRYGTWG